MTRYQKWKGDFLISTIRNDPDKRWRALKKMADTFPVEAMAEVLDFQERFETEDDITATEARAMLREMKEAARC